MPKTIYRFIFTILLTGAVFHASLPNLHACGPGYIEAVFEYEKAPENPYENFAAGKIGILRPTYPRVVLYAAYKYLNGGGFSEDERKSLVEVWEAYFNNKSFTETDVSKAVQTWVEARKKVFGKNEKTPEIYVERAYGGYDFFPNCTKNAFEVAAETLQQRILAHGSNDPALKLWISAQDEVFQNCASGRRIPKNPDAGMPVWLQKDRLYQIAAAEFYSLNFDRAKSMFAEIAQDSESPWQNLSAYLVGRTLIRKASLTKNKNLSETIYIEAEQNLQTVAAGGGEFADSAEDLIGLIKYRIRPEERASELARNLSFYGGDDLRQDLIDYTWLLDSFEAEALKVEEARKEALKPSENSSNANARNDSNSNMQTDEWDFKGISDNSSADINGKDSSREIAEELGKNDLRIKFHNDDFQESWEITVKTDATDEETIAEAEKIAGTLSDKMKERIIEARKNAYQWRVTEKQEKIYRGGYHGEEKTVLEILPQVVRRDDLSDWLFAFQIQGEEAFRYAFSKFQQTSSDIWLVTAISKAEKNSPEILYLLEAAENVDRLSPAYPTVAFHRARLFLETGKRSEAKILLDEILRSSLELPVSTRNQFLEMRLQLAESLDEFLRFSLKKPFTLSQSGHAISLEEEIARQKSFYDPEYFKETREEYENSIEKDFEVIRKIKDEPMIDFHTADRINRNFPIPRLLDILKSKRYPPYLRLRLAKTIWTRAVLLEQFDVADKILLEFEREGAEFFESFKIYKQARTVDQKRNAAVFIILKNPELSPYLSSGLGYPENSYTGASRWWCVPDDEVWDDSLHKSVPRPDNKPDFLSDADKNRAQSELENLKKLGTAANFLTENVLKWARKSPSDERVPESLYLVFDANGWDKFGCGGDFENRKIITDFMRKKYPASPWTFKVIDEESR